MPDKAFPKPNLGVEVTVTFTLHDMPEEGCTLTPKQFEIWLENNGGSLRDHLAAVGNDWIETHLEIDGHMGDAA